MAKTGAKAWLFDSTVGGIVENLRLTEYSLPDSKPDHILIDVLNVSLNPGDYKFAKLPLLKWFIKRPASVCFDFCGRIRLLPNDMTKDARDLHVDQIVFGMHWDLRSLGTLKTSMWVHIDAVYPLSDEMPVDYASAFGVGALTAYQTIAPYAEPGKKILINGGTGGVGTFSIQIAKALGMHVIATCGETGVHLCKELGADETLVYTSPSFLDHLNRIEVDLVVDNVGHDPQLHRRSEMFLKADGQFILVALMDHSWAGVSSMLVSWLCPTWLGGPARSWSPLLTQSKISDLEPVALMASEKKLKVAVDSIFAFEHVPQAFAKLKTGRAKGKIVVNVDKHRTP